MNWEIQPLPFPPGKAVTVGPYSGNVMVTPDLPEPALAIYRTAIERSLEGYRRLTELLTPDFQRDYARVYEEVDEAVAHPHLAEPAHPAAARPSRREVTDEHLMPDDAQRVQVVARVGVVAAYLLRRGVERRV